MDDVTVSRPEAPRESFVAWGERTLPLGADVVTRARLVELLKHESDVEFLRKAIRHGLACYGTTESRRLLEKALEETR